MSILRVTCPSILSLRGGSLLAVIVGRGIVEDGVHLILEDGDAGWLRDVQWTGAFRSQSLAAEVKRFIRTGRHVDRADQVESSTTASRPEDVDEAYWAYVCRAVCSGNRG